MYKYGKRKIIVSWSISKFSTRPNFEILVYHTNYKPQKA